MVWQQTPYTLPLFITTLICFASAGFTYRQRQIPGASDLYKMLIGITLWAFFYALELQAVQLSTKLFMAKVEYMGIVYVPLGYLLFVLHYFGDIQKLKFPRQSISALFIIPSITLLLVWTNEFHHLIWTVTKLTYNEGRSFLAVEYGFWFWVNIGYAYLVLLASSYLLFRKTLTTQELYRGQIILLIAGSLFPWVGNALYVTGNNPFPNLDLTPFSFAATALFFAWALFRFSFLDIVPVARGLVIEKLAEGVIVLDKLYRVIDINETAVTLLQLNKKEIIGQPLQFDHSQCTSLQNMLQQDPPSKIEMTFSDKVYEASVIQLENANSKSLGRLITLHNVTHRKESERLLQQAKEAAEEAAQAKTNFLTNMSHEIRTPLNAVVGMSEMLRQTTLNPNQKEMINEVSKSSQELLLLINNILDFAKLEEGDLNLNKQPFDLVDCIEASLEKVYAAANDKQLRLSYHIAEQTPTLLLGDPVRLRQILVILLENGIKFTEEGYVELSVRLANQSQQAKSVNLQFTIKDSGIGISPEKIQTLFSPFQQGDSSMTRAYGGTGLGLVICKRLVELMGGEIHLHSGEGQGTAVHFSANFKISKEANSFVVTLRNHNATLANKRLLLIISDTTCRRQISKEARTAGLEVYAAGSSKEAIYWINKSQPFDAVLLEMAVWQEEPGITAQLLHRESKLPLPIILLKSAEENMSSAVTKELFAGTLQVPIISSQLYEMLMNVMSVNNFATPVRETGKVMADQHPMNILIVEDNKLNQRILKKMLGELGYEADCAVNGAIGVEAAAKSEYDVILMDIQMPVMDGIEATQEIIAHSPVEKRPYIIAVTAHALEGDREYYLSQNMNAYLSKPVTLNQLVEALYQSIGSKESHLQHAAQKIVSPAASKEPIPTAPTANQPIDFDELARLVGGDTDKFLELMAPIFLEDTQKILRNLEEAIESTNSKGVQQAAHTLKGTSANMGMPQLSAVSREIEMMANGDDLTNISPKFLEIQAEYRRIETALGRFLSVTL